MALHTHIYIYSSHTSPELLTRSRPRAPRLLSGWLACELELSKYREREGVFTRLSVVLKAKQMAPAAWWPASTCDLPRHPLGHIASKVLAQPPFARVGGRAQLEHLRQDQAQGKPKERSCRRGPRQGRQAWKLVYCWTRRRTPATRRPCGEVGLRLRLGQER